MQLYEVLINELYFQGVTIMNELRKVFFLDLIDPKILSIDTKHFNSVILVYPEDDKLHKGEKDGVDESNRIDLPKILQQFCNKKKKSSELHLRKFMIKLFLTLIRNSNEPYNDSILENIIKKFMTPPKINDFNNEYNNLNNDEENTEKIPFESEINKKKIHEDNTRNCIETLLKIIDVGLDKSYEDFMQDITMIAQPIIKVTENFNILANVNLDKWPITEYRYFLKPHYSEKKKLSTSNDSELYNAYSYEKSDHLNIYESYKQMFTQLYSIYFSHLNDETNTEDVPKLEKKRINFYNDFRMKLTLVEEHKVISSFVENLHTFYKKLINEEKFEDDYNNLWSKFIKSKEEFEIKYIIYLVPSYNFDKQIYAHPNKNVKLEENPTLLSEFISYNDNIYRTTTFLPWAVPRDGLNDYIMKLNSINWANDFVGPSLDTVLSYLKDPLSMYISDAEHLFNLNLYKLTAEQGNSRKEYIVWKSIEINSKCSSQKKANDKGKKGENNTLTICNMSLKCVDLLGVHYKDNEKEITSMQLRESAHIKIFNLFFRRDSPFNFNMSSNNGWLEVFACDASYTENSKNFSKVISSKDKKNYFDDFVVPQFELDSAYKNYKATYIDLVLKDTECSIKVDDFEDICKDFNSKSEILIRIEKWERNGKHVSIPVATYMPI